jgi:hypothetical protein
MCVRRRVIQLFGLVGGGFAVRTWYRRFRTWGATPGEVASRLPGDELCPKAAVVHTRAVTVAAPPGDVYPWLTQIGQDRSGFFSYTFLENAVGCRMPRVHERRDEWSTRQVGDRVLMATPERFGGGAYNVVAQVDPGHALVLVAPRDPARIERRESTEWVWSLVVEPGEVLGTSRLVVRSRYLRRQPLLEPVHYVMERRMLRTIAHLASEHRSPMAESELVMAQ